MSFRAVGALALVSAAVIDGNVALAQNDVAAVPRIVTTTESRAASCDRACLEGFVDRYSRP